MKQSTFEGFKKIKDAFGGSLLKSHPKTQRPLDSKHPVHLVLKANESILRTHKNYARVQALVYGISEKHGIRIYELAIANDHIHLLIKISRRPRWAAYIRELTGIIAQKIGVKGRFWRHRPFTRIVRGWRKAFQSVRDYIEMNKWEADGMIDYHDREFVKFLRRAMS